MLFQVAAENDAGFCLIIRSLSPGVVTDLGSEQATKAE